MKKKFYLFSIALVLSLFMSVSARADTNSNSNNSGGFLNGILNLLGLGDNSNNNTSNDKSGSGTQTGTALPINNGVVFLTIAGIAIGIVTLKRAKSGLVAIEGK